MHIVHSAGNMGLFKQTEECTFPSDGVIVVVAPVAVVVRPLPSEDWSEFIVVLRSRNLESRN